MEIKRLLCLIPALVLLLSCTDNDKKDGVLERIPATADMVVVGNVNEIVASAGGTVEKSAIRLPRGVMEHLGGSNAFELKKINRFLKNSHVSMDACALFVPDGEKRSVAVLSLTDRDFFSDAIKKLSYKKIKADSDMDIFVRKVSVAADGKQSSYNYIALKGSYAYVIENVESDGKFSPVKFLQKVYEDAGKKSFARTGFGKYISRDCAIGMAVVNSAEVRNSLGKAGMPSAAMAMMGESVVCMRGKFLANKCIVDMQVFDSEGNELSADRVAPFMDNSATINLRALSFLDERESLVYAFSLKDVEWDRMADLIAEGSGLSRADRAQLNVVMSYLSQIDGTVAIGFGLNGGIGSALSLYMGNEPLSQFSATIVAETKEGKAQRLLEDIKGLLEGMSVPFEEQDGQLSVNTAFMGIQGMLYAKCEGNVLVVANHPVSGNNENIFISEPEIGKSRLALYGKLLKDNKLSSDLNIKDDITFALYCRPGMLSASMIVEVGGDSATDVKSGVIHKLLNITRKDETDSGILD